MTAIQVWIDPAHPTAYRCAHLTAFLEIEYIRRKHIALIRSNPRDAIGLLPPIATGHPYWTEMSGNCSGKETSPEEVLKIMDIKMLQSAAESI